MRKLIIGLSILVAGITHAQDSFKYEPVANKAEYYVSTYNDRKDMGDYLKWADDFKEYLAKSDVYDSMQSVILVPYFHQNLQAADSVWLNIWPSATKQFAGAQHWLQNGSSILSKLPVTNSQAVDTYQWAISVPDEEGGNGMVRFADCTLKEGVSEREAFDAYKDFAKAAKAKGDNLGRKMIFPSSGATSDDFDYVYSLYSSTVSELGSGADNYWENINGSKEDIALDAIIESCTNTRTYATMSIKSAK